MANNIRILPSELQRQASKLNDLANQMDDITAKSLQAVKMMEEALHCGSAFSVISMLTGKSLFQERLENVTNSLRTGAEIANTCATTFENADKVIRDKIGDSLPAEVVNTTPSGQYVVDKGVYNQLAYDHFWTEYDWNYDGVKEWVNTGCVITSCAYALTLMGIPTTPQDAYVRSGNTCDAWYDKIANSGGVQQAYYSGVRPVSELNAMAIQAKESNYSTFSPLMLRVNGNTHTVVLEDIETDGNGNITKYVVFDPYKGVTKEYASWSDMGKDYTVNNFTYYTRA